MTSTPEDTMTSTPHTQSYVIDGHAHPVAIATCSCGWHGQRYPLGISGIGERRAQDEAQGHAIDRHSPFEGSSPYGKA